MSLLELLVAAKNTHKCHICGKLVQCRSNMYGHYSRKHYKEELGNLIGETLKCPVCKVVKASKYDLVVHVGRVHIYLEKFLPKKYHISIQSPNKEMNKQDSGGFFNLAVQNPAIIKDLTNKVNEKRHIRSKVIQKRKVKSPWSRRKSLTSLSVNCAMTISSTVEEVSSIDITQTFIINRNYRISLGAPFLVSSARR